MISTETLDRLDFNRTARHESGHAVAAVRLSTRLDYVTIVPGEKSLGHARFAYDERNGLETENTIIVRLLGYLSQRTAPVTWPPDYVDALNCDLEGLGKALRLLGTSRARYIHLCAIAMDYAADPTFQRQVELVTIGLRRKGYLTREEVEAFMAAAD